MQYKLEHDFDEPITKEEFDKLIEKKNLKINNYGRKRNKTYDSR